MSVQLQLLTMQQAALLLHVSDRMIKRLVQQRAFPVVKVGRHVRISEDALNEYIQRQTRAAEVSAHA